MSTVTVNTVLVERPTIYGNISGYNVASVIVPGVANAAGGGAGQTVTVSLAFSEQNLPSDLSYAISLSASQACSISWANKAAAGFDVILTPLNSGVTLSAGTFDVSVSWSHG